jgi:hypothetical protein
MMKQEPIGLGEKAVCLVCQLISERRFPDTPARLSTSDETIALQHGKVRSHRVVSETERVCQLVDRTWLISEQRDDLPTSRSQKPFISADDHRLRLPLSCPT